MGWGGIRGIDIYQKTIGIIGLGRIGKGVAKRAKGFDMRVLAYEPYPDMAFVEANGVELVSMEDLLAQTLSPK